MGRMSAAIRNRVADFKMIWAPILNLIETSVARVYTSFCLLKVPVHNKHYPNALYQSKKTCTSSNKENTPCPYRPLYWQENNSQ